MPEGLTTPSISAEDRERLKQSGIELSMINRCGSYMQMNQDVLHATCAAKGVEVLSIADALER